MLSGWPICMMGKNLRRFRSFGQIGIFSSEYADADGISAPTNFMVPHFFKKSSQSLRKCARYTNLGFQGQNFDIYSNSCSVWSARLGVPIWEARLLISEVVQNFQLRAPMTILIAYLESSCDFWSFGIYRKVSPHFYAKIKQKSDLPHQPTLKPTWRLKVRLFGLSCESDNWS